MIRDEFEKHVEATSVCWVEEIRGRLFERNKAGQYTWQGLESRFRGFQAGHAAGVEDAIEICLENGDHNTADDLWPEMFRIVADVAPRYVFAENVSRKAIEAAASDLRSLGYKTKALPLAASDLGADHIRERFWLRAYADKNGKLPRPINAETSVLQKLRAGVWETGPDELRVPNGLAAGLEPVKSAGNGQVPIVAATAWEVLATTPQGDNNGMD